MVLKNSRGSALVLILATLPVIVTALILTFSLIGFLQNDLALKYECRVGGQNGQHRTAPLLKKLLDLNLNATHLEARYVAAKIKLAAAIASGEFWTVPSAQAQVNKILGQKKTLDAQQKELIRQSNAYLRRAFNSTKQQIEKTGRNLTNPLLSSKLTSMKGDAPELAVRPDSSDIAPTYSLKEDFENEQALAHEWQYNVAVRSPFSNFLPGEFRFKKACAVSLEKELMSWSPKIIKGKFSLKSVW